VYSAKGSCEVVGAGENCILGKQSDNGEERKETVVVGVEGVYGPVRFHMCT
jgi:hypothetical protein